MATLRYPGKTEEMTREDQHCFGNKIAQERGGEGGGGGGGDEDGEKEDKERGRECLRKRNRRVCQL